MNNNGSRNWLLWLAVILAVVAAVYFVRNRMQKSEVAPAQEVTVLAEEVSVETQVDAVPVEATEVVEAAAAEQA